MTYAEQFKADFQRQISGIAEDLDDIVTGNNVAEFIHNYDCEDDGEDYEDVYARLNKYFEDALDVEFIIGYDGKYRGTRVAITLGGPNIYLDTRDGIVKGYWGGDKAQADLYSRTATEIDAYWEEQWSCINC